MINITNIINDIRQVSYVDDVTPKLDDLRDAEPGMGGLAAETQNASQTKCQLERGEVE